MEIFRILRYEVFHLRSYRSSSIDSSILRSSYTSRGVVFGFSDMIASTRQINMPLFQRKSPLLRNCCAVAGSAFPQTFDLVDPRAKYGFARRLVDHLDIAVSVRGRVGWIPTVMSFPRFVGNPDGEAKNAPGTHFHPAGYGPPEEPPSPPRGPCGARTARRDRYTGGIPAERLDDDVPNRI